MKVEFLAQPDARLGDCIEQVVAKRGTPLEFVIVSAFASLLAALRIKPYVEAVVASGGEVRVVLGVDLGGTSKEVLREVASWSVPVTIVKNRAGGVVFHPKLYLLRWATHAEVIVASNNLTEGGLYRNYEAASRTIFDLEADVDAFGTALSELDRFLRPSGPTAALLSSEYLAALVALPEIPSETDARRKRGEAHGQRGIAQPPGVFGFETVPSPPKLPAELQDLLFAARANREATYKKAVAQAKRAARGRTLGPPPQKPPLSAQLDPAAFYMTLAATRSNLHSTIPGEQRIPLEARDLAEDFWGWPDNYQRSVSPRKGTKAKVERVYWNWRPIWRTSSTDDPASVETSDVRMYFYENSADFRFYSGDLVRLKAVAGDIVRLRRIDEPDAEFECLLARKGTSDYDEWLPLLKYAVGNSTRRFGFA